RTLQVRIDALKRESPNRWSAGPLTAKVRDQGHTLIETSSPGESSRLRDIGRLSGLDIVRRIERHARRYVVEQLVVCKTESSSHHEGAASGRIGETEHRSEVALVRMRTACRQFEAAVPEHDRRRSRESRIDVHDLIRAQ